ncbi:MAG: dCTP deaminase [Methanoregula sp.]|jgi:dCTP deaminase|nr:dCTP deaminase [Methanoregula sp.]
MILSGTEIRQRLGKDSTQGNLVIQPYSEECQQPASYDLRADNDYLLARGACMLISSLEWVELPRGIAGTLRCRSSFGRRGVLLGAGFVDPGFRGKLTLCLTNLGNADIAIQRNDRVVQMVFHEVKGGEMIYQGRYQDSNGIVEARPA